MIRYLIIFKGRVQGVGFRYTAYNIANSLNLTGYVENLYNGDVRCEIQGKKEEINAFLDKILNNSSYWIKIDDYSMKQIDIIEDEMDFKIA